MTSFRPYRGCRVIITGAAGFIGSRLLERLVGLGANVQAWVRPGSKCARLNALPKSSFSIREVDLKDSVRQASFVRKFSPRAVFHLGASGVDGRLTDRDQLWFENVRPTMDWVDTSRDMGFRLVVSGTMFELPSSTSRQAEGVIPCPINAYAWSKSAALQYFQSPTHRDSNWIWLRLFGVYGPGESPHRVMPHAMARLMMGESVELSSCRIVRDWIHVEDVVDALMCAGIARASSLIYHIGTGRGVELRQVLAEFFSSHGSRHLLKFGVRPDRVPEAYSLISNSRNGNRDWGWKATQTIQKGLQSYLKWCKTSAGMKYLGVPSIRNPKLQ